MTNKMTMSALALATAALTMGSARAADLYTKAPSAYAQPLPAAFSWTGFYAGANVGGGFSGADAFNSYLGPTGSKADGIVGGIQLGYNYQVSPMFVVGIENDFMASGIKSRGIAGNEVSLPFYGTGRARAGIALLDQRLLVYGTAGMAFGEVKDSGIDKARIGWTAGTGVEWAFRQNWSAKVEYLYTDLRKDFKKDAALPDREQKFQTVTVGVNYHF
jgi:outer membrane immunogenic protein